MRIFKPHPRPHGSDYLQVGFQLSCKIRFLGDSDACLSLRTTEMENIGRTRRTVLWEKNDELGLECVEFEMSVGTSWWSFQSVGPKTHDIRVT